MIDFTDILKRHRQMLYVSASALTLAPVFTLAGGAYAQDAVGAPIPAVPASSDQNVAAPEGGGDTNEEEDIVVTGRAVPGAVIGDIPPENQLRPADVAAFGVSSVSELLEQISDQTQSAQGRDGGSGPIILVNGKRVSGVNEVGDLPTESILRVDILPEEVALKYGYGASQKVVNIILRRFFRSMVVDVRGEMATEGQGEQARGEFTYTQIRNNNRLNLAGRVKTEASILESDRSITPANTTAIDPTGTLANETDYRTLNPRQREYSLNGVYSHEVSKAVTAVVNARAALTNSKDLQGFATDTLTVPASNPYAQSASEETVDRYLNDRVLLQNKRTAQLHGGVSVNATLPKSWQLSFTGNYDHGDSRTGTDRGYDTDALQSAITAGSAAINPYGVFSPALLGDVIRDRATSRSDSGDASVVAMGKLFRLPAGDISTSIRFGGSISAVDSEVLRNGVLTSSEDTSRSEFNTQASFDIPLTSKKNGFLGEIGSLTANLNVGATRVSNFGTLGTFGYGLNWAPTSWVSFIASINQDRTAPTLSQLNSPLVTTENVRIYDYVRGQTVAVTRISGGNADLKADDRHVFKLGMTLKPATRLALTANYVNSRIDNAIGSLPSITAAIEAAFPDRYTRDSTGALVSVDNRPINFARQEQEQIRWGITFTKVLREPRRPERPPMPPGAGATGGSATREGWRQRMQGQDAQRGTGAQGAQGQQPRQSGQATDAPPPSDQQIVVNGDRQQGSDFPPPPPGFGRDGGRDGMGPPDGFGPRGDFAGGPPPDGFGGPGGPGGGGGRGPGPGFTPGGNGATLQFSLFHNWYLRNRILLTDGGPAIDLLNGGSGNAGGGQPRHVVQFNGGVSDNGVGLRLSGKWQSATNVTADQGSSSGNLHFSSLWTADVRLFANLANRFPNENWAKGTRVSLSVENVFNRRQTVTDKNGATPLAYQKGYLDPMGRTISLSIRRIF